MEGWRDTTRAGYRGTKVNEAKAGGCTAQHGGKLKAVSKGRHACASGAPRRARPSLPAVVVAHLLPHHAAHSGLVQVLLLKVKLEHACSEGLRLEVGGGG